MFAVVETPSLLAELGPIILALISLAITVAKVLETRAARSMIATHQASATQAHERAETAHELLGVLFAGMEAHEAGQDLRDSALIAAKSDAAHDLLNHFLATGGPPPLPGSAPSSPASRSSGPSAAPLGALLLACALGFVAVGCTSAQIATAEASVHRLATGAQVTLAAFKANEVTIDQLASDAGAALAKSKAGSAAAAKVEAGLAAVQANPAATDLLEEGLAELAAATAPAPSPSPAPSPAPPQ